MAASLFFAAQATPIQNVAVFDAAQDPATDVKDEAAEDDNKRECRRVALIGTRMKKKVCATRKEWREMARQSRNTTEDIQRRGQVPGSGIGG